MIFGDQLSLIIERVKQARKSVPRIVYKDCFVGLWGALPQAFQEIRGFGRIPGLKVKGANVLVAFGQTGQKTMLKVSPAAFEPVYHK